MWHMCHSTEAADPWLSVRVACIITSDKVAQPWRLLLGPAFAVRGVGRECGMYIAEFRGGAAILHLF